MANFRTNAEHANRTLIKLDGVTVGMAQSCRASDDYGVEGQYGIGDIHAQEFTPSQARHSVNLTQLKFKNASLRGQGLVPENGDAALQGVEFDILMQDKDSGQVKRKYIGCVFASGDIDVQKNQVVSGSATFMCRDVSGSGF